MAQEIEITVQLRSMRDKLEVGRRAADFKIDQAAIGYVAGTQAANLAHAPVDIDGEIAVAGWAFFRNHDETETIYLGLASPAVFFPFAELAPGEVAMMRLATKDIYAAASADGVKLEYFVMEA